MKFDDAKEKMTTVHKLHTARDSEGETIVYKKPYSAKKLTVITNKKHSFDLNKVSYLSLSDLGLLIQYEPVNKKSLHPFPINTIEDIIVES